MQSCITAPALRELSAQCSIETRSTTPPLGNYWDSSTKGTSREGPCPGANSSVTSSNLSR